MKTRVSVLRNKCTEAFCEQGSCIQNTLFALKVIREYVSGFRREKVDMMITRIERSLEEVDTLMYGICFDEQLEFKLVA